MAALEIDADYTYNFGITVVENKHWFYQLSMSGQLWNDEHIDVIFYYLRKKGKYDRRSTFKYTTVDCLFMQKVDQTYLAYNNPETGPNVANEEDDICQYVKGYRLHANVPWHSVDNIFIPVNIKEDNHWILVVLSFNDRRLYVYKSYRGSAGHNVVVRKEVQKLVALLPHYLHISGFYTKKTGINWQNHPAYTGMTQNENIQVEYVENLPQQDTISMDCGVYVAAFAEYLSTGEGIPTQIDATMLRNRYGTLLWDNAARKIDEHAMSNIEEPPKPVRPAVDYGKADRIDVT
ncbi:uncharacterized protein LOC132606444 isoform X2 [Lycium barbarum]|uniref:uncharacterized protein LOC132606444 isoform X2 n=1 Tax=Lycium barbarum TaxID=112863 RepID=UPI00293EDB27|nr:uncharacterized protein LOC132606444 isoform X2 [Lycium barbarum]